MAQFLTFQNKVVASQKGHGTFVEVFFRGERKPLKVPADQWMAQKKLEYFDSNKIKRADALDLYERAQQTSR